MLGQPSFNPHTTLQKRIQTAIRNNDVQNLHQLWTQAPVSVQFPQGQSLLDYAYIHQSHLAAAYLKEHGVGTLMSSENIAHLRGKLLSEGEPSSYRCIIQLNSGSHFSIELSKLVENPKSSEHHRFNFDLNEPFHKNSDHIQVINKDHSKMIVLKDHNQPNQPLVLLEVFQDKVSLIHSHPKFGDFDITANIPLECSGPFYTKALSMKAPSFELKPEVVLTAHSMTVDIAQSLTLRGVTLAHTLKATCKDWQHGEKAVTQIRDDYTIQCKNQFVHQGALAARLKGRIRAHSIDIQQKGGLNVTEGPLFCFGKAKLNNAGGLVADHIVLDSKYLVANRATGVVKAKTCSVPPSASQFANGGFFLVGRTENQTVFEKTLNLAHAGVNIASLFSLAPINWVIKLRSGLLYLQAMNHGVKLFEKIHQGQADEISSNEWVHFFLDHVIPSVGSLVDQESQYYFISSLLYQMWGWQLSEDEFVDKSLSFIELLIRGASAVSKTALSDDQIKMLDKTAEIIRHSKQYLKYAQGLGEVLHAHIQNDADAIANAQVTLEAISEGLTRDFLHTLNPVKVFEVELSPKELGLFVMDKAYTLKKADLAHRVIFGSIYALTKSDIISDNTKNNLEYLSHLFTSFSPSLYDCVEKYSKDELSYNETMSLVLRELMAYATYSAQFKTLQAKEQEKDHESIVQDIEQVEEEGELHEVHTHEVIESSIEAQEESEAIKEGEELSYEKEEVELPQELETPDLDQLQDTIHENAEKVHVEHEYEALDVSLNVLKVVDQFNNPAEREEDLGESHEVEEKPVDASTLSQAFTSKVSELWNEGLQHEHAQALNELNRVLLGQGEGAMHGHLGVLADIFQNQGMIDTAGNINLSFVEAQNSNLIKATDSIHLNGLDVDDRDEGGKLREVDVSPDGHSQFVNHEAAFVKAGGDITSRGVGATRNDGTLQAQNYKSAYGLRHHSNSGAILTAEDISIKATEDAHSSGVMAGKSIHHEGTRKAEINEGKMYAQEKITHVSRHKTTQTTEGQSAAKEVHFQGAHVTKEGVTRAQLATVNGYDDNNPESVYLGSGANDVILGMKVATPSEQFSMQSDAFNGSSLTELGLDESMLGSCSIVDLSPDFKNVLQVTIPQTDTTFSMTQLPQIHEDASFIFNAPGSALESVSDGSFHYQGTLTFIGDTFHQMGDASLDKGIFDVHFFKVEDGESVLTLTKGGVIQAEHFSNEGHLHSGGMIHWNVKFFENEAQLKEVIQTFQHSKQTPVIDTHIDTHVVPNSGTITAAGHTGYVGNFNQKGGQFLAGDEGIYVYADDAEQKALFSVQSQYTTGAVEDKGMSWHAMPVSHESSIGSTGSTVVLGTGKMHAGGLKLWGDKGVQAHFNHGIEEGQRDVAPYVIQQAISHEKGKDHVIVPHQQGQVISNTQISSNFGDIQLGSSQGEIDLRNALIATPGDAVFVAKTKVVIQGQEYHTHESVKYSQHNLTGKKKIESYTDSITVEPSLIFVGGDVSVSCMEFHLGAVEGVIDGDMKVTAMVTDLYGLDEHYHNETSIKSYGVGLPTDRLLGMLDNHNAQAIFTTLIQNCGWDAQSLKSLTQAGSPEEIPGHLLACAKSAWDLTALVAKASNQAMNGDKMGFIGSITDQLGLTTRDSDGNLIPSTKVHLNWSKTKEQTDSHTKNPTHLYIGGTFELKGQKLLVRDGSKISAEHLIIALAEGIEFTANKTTTQFTSKTKDVSVGVNLLNPESVDVAANKSSDHEATVDYQLAGLEARDTALVKTGGAIKGQGRLTGKNGKITAPELDFDSPQSTHSQTTQASGVSLSTDLTSVNTLVDHGYGSVHNSHSSMQSGTTHEQAGIDLGEGIVQTNKAHLANGSEIKAGIVEREDGQAGLPQITGSAAHDYHTSSQSSFALSGSLHGGEQFGQFNSSKDYDGVTHQPTVVASNISPNDLDGINSDPTQQHQEHAHKHSGASIAVWKPDQERLKEQAQDISEFGEHLASGANKALTFLFGAQKEPDSSRAQLYSASLEAENVEEEPAQQAPSYVDDEFIEEGGQTLDPTLDPNDEEGIQYTPSEQLIAEGELAKESAQNLQSSDPDDGKSSEHPGLSHIYKIPDAEKYLSNMTSEEIRMVAQIIDDYVNGVPNNDLQSILSAQQNTSWSMVDALNSALSIIPEAQAHPAVAYGVIGLLTAAGIIAGNTGSTTVPFVFKNPEDELEDAWQKNSIHAQQMRDESSSHLNPSTMTPRPDEHHPDVSHVNGFNPDQSPVDSSATPLPVMDLNGMTIYEHPISKELDPLDFVTQFPGQPILGFYAYYKAKQNEKLDAKIGKQFLPTASKYPSADFTYKLPDKTSGMIPKGELNGKKGFIDKDKNVWVKGPCHEHGSSAPYEWDVQLTQAGKNKLKHLIGDAEYANVSIDGNVRRINK